MIRGYGTIFVLGQTSAQARFISVDPLIDCLADAGTFIAVERGVIEKGDHISIGYTIHFSPGILHFIVSRLPLSICSQSHPVSRDYPQLHWSTPAVFDDIPVCRP